MGFLCVKACVSALVCISCAFLWIFVCLCIFLSWFVYLYLSYFTLLVFSILFYILIREKGEPEYIVGKVYFQ